MFEIKNNILLYLVTDRAWLNGSTLEDAVRQALQGGATMVQLREKNLSYDKFVEEAFKIKDLCKEFNVPFIVNDNVNIAKEVDADGVHVGQSDMDILHARTLLGKDKIIGVSAETLEEAIIAEKNGADYLGVGAVFKTDTKKDALTVSFDTLKNICSRVKIPVCTIGGISKDNIGQLKNSGISGIAVVSAIMAQKDIKSASEEIKKDTLKVVNNE